MMKLWFMRHSFRVRVGCWGLGSPRFTQGWYVLPRWGISLQSQVQHQHVFNNMAR